MKAGDILGNEFLGVEVEVGAGGSNYCPEIASSSRFRSPAAIVTTARPLFIVRQLQSNPS
jgi:hypothetical protein